MNILIFYFVSVFVSAQHGSAGAVFTEEKESCNFGATFSAKHGGTDPHWSVLKVTINLQRDQDEDGYYSVDSVNRGKPS